MLEKIITQAGKALQAAFEPQACNSAARRTGWLIRQSKLDGYLFLKVLVIGFLKHPRASLNQLSQEALDLGVSISPQGLHERINPAGVVFLQERLVAILAQMRAQRQGVIEALQGFSEVYFQDSTTISLPAGLQTVFPGGGGKASPAAIKIQLLFAFLSGQIAHWVVQAGRSADQSYDEHLAHLQPGSLLIQDLGFFTLGLLQQVVQQQAFFLTRMRQGIQIFLDTTPTQALDVLDHLRQQGLPVADYAVQVGSQARLAGRLIAVHLPDPLAAQRRRRVHADSVRRGRTPSQRTLSLCAWNLFFTNLPAERLSLHQLLVSYSLRWQVELIFKLWNSQAAIAQLAGFRKERILGELYAQMIGLVLTHFLVAPLRFLLLEQHLEISAAKARQVLQDRISCLEQALGEDIDHLTQELGTLCNRILCFARKTRRKKRLSSLERLHLADQVEVAMLYPLA